MQLPATFAYLMLHGVVCVPFNRSAEKAAEEARTRVLTQTLDRLEDELLEQGLSTERAEREASQLRAQWFAAQSQRAKLSCIKSAFGQW